MSLFICSPTCPLVTSAAAVARVAATKTRLTSIFAPSTTPSRGISYAAGQRSHTSHTFYRGHDVWRQRSLTWAIGQSNGGRRRTFFSHDQIRDYEQLPKEYRDKVGLVFAKKELTDAQVERIFGAGVKTGPANHLLRVLHGRRIAGTLDDPAYAGNTIQFTEGQVATALAYLRKTVPVEEVRNAGLRAEDELMQLEAELEQAEKAKAAKSSASKTQDTELESPPQPEVKCTPDPVYGSSAFDRIRATNEAKQQAKNDALDEELRAKEEAEGVVPGTLAEQDQVAGSNSSRTRAITNPAIQAYYDAAQSDLTQPPEMSPLTRILPTAVVVALVIGLMAAVSMVYEEPAARYRLLPEVSTSHATVATLIGANVLVYLAWKVPPLWRQMNRLFIVSVAVPRAAAAFAAVFSHQSLSHLLTNMVPLAFIGPALHDEMGRARFLTLFMACGSLSFVGSLATYTLRGMLGTSTLGASGAMLGLCAAYFWEHRMDGFRILGLPEHGVHGIIFLAGLLALQLAGLGRTVSKKVDLASHLTGIVAGMASIEVMQRTAQWQQNTPTREGGGQGRSIIEVWFWLKPWLQPSAAKDGDATKEVAEEAVKNEKTK